MHAWHDASGYLEAAESGSSRLDRGRPPLPLAPDIRHPSPRHTFSFKICSKFRFLSTLWTMMTYSMLHHSTASSGCSGMELFMFAYNKTKMHAYVCIYV